MTLFEILTLANSVLVVILMLVAVIRGREMNELKRMQSDQEIRLNEIKLQEYRETEQAKAMAQIDVTMESITTRDLYSFVLRNTGHAPAQNVTLKIISLETRQPLHIDNPRMLPLKSLDPAQRVSVKFNGSSDRRPPFEIELIWEDSNGEPRQKTITIHDSMQEKESLLFT